MTRPRTKSAQPKRTSTCRGRPPSRPCRSRNLTRFAGASRRPHPVCRPDPAPAPRLTPAETRRLRKPNHRGNPVTKETLSTAETLSTGAPQSPGHPSRRGTPAAGAPQPPGHPSRRGTPVAGGHQSPGATSHLRNQISRSACEALPTCCAPTRPRTGCRSSGSRTGIPSIPPELQAQSSRPCRARPKAPSTASRTGS